MSTFICFQDHMLKEESIKMSLTHEHERTSFRSRFRSIFYYLLKFSYEHALLDFQDRILQHECVICQSCSASTRVEFFNPEQDESIKMWLTREHARWIFHVQILQDESIISLNCSSDTRVKTFGPGCCKNIPQQFKISVKMIQMLINLIKNYSIKTFLIFIHFTIRGNKVLLPYRSGVLSPVFIQIKMYILKCTVIGNIKMK